MPGALSSVLAPSSDAVSSPHCQETQQFGLLRRFLRVNKIPDGLGSRITRFLQYTYHQRETNSHDPYILDYLSKSLQASKIHLLTSLSEATEKERDLVLSIFFNRINDSSCCDKLL